MLRIMFYLIAIVVMPGRMIVKRSSRSIRGCMTAVLMYSVDAECNGSILLCWMRITRITRIMRRRRKEEDKQQEEHLDQEHEAGTEVLPRMARRSAAGGT
jgi:hypothetical protein